MESNRFVRLYRDWCVVGTLGCAIAGFPTTPLGPLLLWAVILPGLAAWLVWRRPEPRTVMLHPRRSGMQQARRRLPLAHPDSSR